MALCAFALVGCSSSGDETATNGGSGSSLAGAAGTGGASGKGASGGTGGGTGGATSSTGGTSSGGTAATGGGASGKGGGGAAGQSGNGGVAGAAGKAGAAGTSAGGALQGGSGGVAGTGQAGSSSCSPHVCLGVECGVFPDGCGSTVDCGDCGSPGMTCIKEASPQFQNKVKNAVEQCKTDHPDYFDFTNTNPPGGSDNVAVAMPTEFDAYVVGQVNGGGDTCISDPNDNQEIRVKGATDAAENYRIRVLLGPNAVNGYCAYKYQSTCSPAGF